MIQRWMESVCRHTCIEDGTMGVMFIVFVRLKSNC